MATKGIWMPIDVLHDKTLTMLEKLVLMEIYQLLELDQRQCYASNEHFSKLLNISRKSVSNIISNLVEKERILVELSDRNHKRLLSIKDGQVSIKDGESKENKTTNNKNTKKSKYESFIIDLKSKATSPSKVTPTKNGKEFFKSVKNVELLTSTYLLHQIEKKEFASRITLFMEDYISKQDNIVDPNDMSTWERVEA